MNKRKVQVAVISDVHLGTYGCQASELLLYLKSIEPETLILNGDIIDIWQFSKRYWPQSHMEIVKYITEMISNNVKVYYITGNHDEMLRKFVGLELGNFKIVNKVVLELDGKKTWLFHGDVFDVTMKHSKWLAKLGGVGYDILIRINNVINYFSIKMGKGKISLSKKIKNSVKKAVKHINDFENTAAEIAISNNFDFVICGHIHQPQNRIIKTEKGEVSYLNSGDWIENLTALEYNDKKWNIYFHQSSAQNIKAKEESLTYLNDKQIFSQLLQELNFTSVN